MQNSYSLLLKSCMLFKLYQACVNHDVRGGCCSERHKGSLRSLGPSGEWQDASGA